MERLASRRVELTGAVVAAVLLQLLGAVAVAQATANCSTHCGSFSISYPFGIEPGCYHDGFNLTCECDHSERPPKLFLGDGTIKVLEISIPSGTVRINSSSIVPLSAPNTTTDDAPGKVNRTGKYHTWSGLRQGGPFCWVDLG